VIRSFLLLIDLSRVRNNSVDIEIKVEPEDGIIEEINTDSTLKHDFDTFEYGNSLRIKNYNITKTL